MPIEALSIEITTRCNAGCIMCPQPSSERRGRDMPADQVFSLIDQGAEMGCPLVLPHHLGEPTLHPDYPEILRYCTESGMRVKTYTNGSRLLKPLILDAIREHADEVVVSVDGCDPETMAAIRPGVDAAEVIPGVALLCQRPRSCLVVARMTEQPENEGERDRYDAFWRGVGVDATVICPDIYDGPGQDVRNCARPFEQIAVLIDGTVILCCRDHHAQHVMGNALTDGLRAVWEGAGAEEVRRQHRAGEIPLCRSCTWVGKRIAL